MLEDWELSANDNTRRIMGRQCIREIAKSIEAADGSRVYVTGRKGTGKTAALLSIVASARLSGHIVLFLPDGDRLSERGFYIEPNKHLKASTGEKLFDLPVLSQEICGQLMEAHSKDFEGMDVSNECLQKWMSDKDIIKLMKALERDSEDYASIALTDILKIGTDTVNIAAGCYNAAIDTLMNQTDKPFTVVMDEFNSYFDHGHYFHMEYDPAVSRPIPSHKINLFQPFVNAMGVQKSDKDSFDAVQSVPMKLGGIVAGITESHAIKQIFTNALTDAMNEAGVKIVDVPPFSHLEVEHILANFEIAGIGRLRFDRGETVMNKQEVAYLRMVSGGYGQSLLDASIM